MSAVTDRLIFWGVVAGAGIVALELLYESLPQFEKEIIELVNTGMEAERDSLAYNAAVVAQQASWKLRLMALYARFRGQFQEGILPKIGGTSTPDVPAVPGKYLGKPKNALGIAGLVRSVENTNARRSDGEMQIVSVPLFADTVMIDAAIENQSENAITGSPSIRVGGRTVQGAPVDLQPGEFRQLTFRVPTDYAERATLDLALRYKNYTLDQVKVGLVL